MLLLYLGQGGDGVDLVAVRQDGLSDVSEGQTHRPRPLASVLRHVQRPERVHSEYPYKSYHYPFVHRRNGN